MVWDVRVVGFCAAPESPLGTLPWETVALAWIQGCRGNLIETRTLKVQAFVVKKRCAECYCPGNLISAVKRQMANKEGRWYAAKSRLKGALCQIFSGGFPSGVGGYPNPKRRGFTDRKSVFGIGTERTLLRLPIMSITSKATESYGVL